MRPADALPEDVRERIEAMANNLRGAQRPGCEAVEFRFDKLAAFEMESALRALLATVERLAADKARLGDALDGLYDRVHAIPTLELRGAKDADGLYVQRSQVHFAITAARRATTTDQGEG